MSDTELRNYRTQGQAQGSNDCGYFCGWVVHLGNIAPYMDGVWNFSRSAVYSQRDSFLGRSRSSGLPGNSLLTDCAAPRFLSTMFGSCIGYSLLRTRSNLQTALQSTLATGKGVMLLLHPASAGLMQRNHTAGHWVAVLPHRNRSRCYYYDPGSGGGPNGTELELQQVSSGLAGQVTSMAGPPGTQLDPWVC